jgi:DNA-binding CsgD family transcriptional regulator
MNDGSEVNIYRDDGNVGCVHAVFGGQGGEMNDRHAESGALALEFHELAYGCNCTEFQERALAKLSNLIGFDRAWWGVMSPEGHEYDLLWSYRANLPSSYEEHWKTVSFDDRLADSVRDEAERTVMFDTLALHGTRGLYEINSSVRNKNALCTSVKLPEHGEAFMFLSIFRVGRSPAYSEEEASIKQFVMPHLNLAWKHNLLRAMDAEQRQAERLLACAVLDVGLSVLQPDMEFVELIRRISPFWCPPNLPVSLQAVLQSARLGNPVVWHGVEFQIRLIGAMRLLTVGRISVASQLTRRENEIASLFASGLSYKEVARRLAISPATARHHLRSIYGKLGVADKAALARLLPTSHQVPWTAS